MANTQSKSVPARPTTVPSLPHTCFLCQRIDPKGKKEKHILIKNNILTFKEFNNNFKTKFC